MTRPNWWPVGFSPIFCCALLGLSFLSEIIMRLGHWGELETTETLRDPINCVIYWKGTRNGSRLTDWEVPFCRVRKWPSIISGASSSLYFTVGESVVALYSSLYYIIPSFLKDFDGILNEWKLYLNLIKQGKSAIQLQVNDTHIVIQFFSLFFFLWLCYCLGRRSFLDSEARR